MPRKEQTFSRNWNTEFQIAVVQKRKSTGKPAQADFPVCTQSMQPLLASVWSCMPSLSKIKHQNSAGLSIWPQWQILSVWIQTNYFKIRQHIITFSCISLFKFEMTVSREISLGWGWRGRKTSQAELCVHTHSKSDKGLVVQSPF